eukprot:2071878-Prymnesium_polylepis.2
MWRALVRRMTTQDSCATRRDTAGASVQQGRVPGREATATGAAVVVAAVEAGTCRASGAGGQVQSWHAPPSSKVGRVPDEIVGGDVRDALNREKAHPNDQLDEARVEALARLGSIQILDKLPRSFSLRTALSPPRPQR